MLHNVSIMRLALLPSHVLMGLFQKCDSGSWYDAAFITTLLHCVVLKEMCLRADNSLSSNSLEFSVVNFRLDQRGNQLRGHG